MFNQEEASKKISMPDLIVNECLFGCEGCPAIWQNGQTGHRIICKCDCGHIRHKKNVEKVMLEGASHGWETEGHQSERIAINRYLWTKNKQGPKNMSLQSRQYVAVGGCRLR
jgi:hypothetical protein